MNQLEALSIDTKHKILPGGSGEHEFYVSDNYTKVKIDLLNFTSHCGGYLEKVDSNILLLSVRSGASYRIKFTGNRVSKIYTKIGDEYRMYWCEKHQRNLPDGHYQQNNIHMPLLQSNL